MFQGQFDAVADQRLTRHQFEIRRAVGQAKGGDQPDARGVAPDQHRRPRHQVAVHPLGHHHPVILAGGAFHQTLEIAEAHIVIRQRMRQIKDRVAFRLPVDAGQAQLARLGQLVEHHLARLSHRGQLGRVTEQDQRREDLAQVFQLPFVQHRGFVDEAHVQRFLAPFPALDEIRSAQTRRSQCAGDRGDLVVKRLGPVQRQFGQPLYHRAAARACQPFGDAFVLGIIDRCIDDAVDRGRGHTLRTQHRCRLVGGGKDCQRPAVAAPAPLPIARHKVHTGRNHRLGQAGQQHGLARTGLADHGKHR